jgi:ankyrin repeat protein
LQPGLAGATVLHKMASNGNEEIAALLLRRDGLDINAHTDMYEYTALHFETLHGSGPLLLLIILALSDTPWVLTILNIRLM